MWAVWTDFVIWLTCSEDDDEETNVRPQVDPHEEDEQRPPDQDNSGELL